MQCNDPGRALPARPALDSVDQRALTVKSNACDVRVAPEPALASSTALSDEQGNHLTPEAAARPATSQITKTSTQPQPSLKYV